jgi:hypothetical protein
MDNLHSMADRLQLSRVSRALICTCGSGVPEEEEFIVATLLGLVQKRLSEFPFCYSIVTDGRREDVIGRVDVVTNSGRIVSHPFKRQEDLLEILTREYEGLKSLDM